MQDQKALTRLYFSKTNVVDCHLIREDRGDAYIVMRYDDYLAEMRRLRVLKKQLEDYQVSTNTIESE